SGARGTAIAHQNSAPREGAERRLEFEPGDDARAREPALRSTAASVRARADSAAALSRSERDRTRGRDSSRAQEERNSADPRARGRARRFGGGRSRRVTVATRMARRTWSSAERRANLLDASRNLSN